MQTQGCRLVQPLILLSQCCRLKETKNIARIANAVQVITSARGTVIAAEVAVKNMYHEEPELLPAASGTNTEKGAPPTVGGDEEPVWPWEQPVWPAEVAAAAHLTMGGAISADSGDQTGQDSNISLLWITEIHLRD